jgi:hypothetical protein
MDRLPFSAKCSAILEAGDLEAGDLEVGECDWKSMPADWTASITE